MTAFDLDTIGRPDGPIESRLRSQVLLNRRRFVAVAVLIIITISVTLVLAGISLLVGFDRWTDLAVTIALAGGVPALLAPPLLLYLTSFVVELDQASRLLQTAASTDPLTSLLNRRGFFATVARTNDERCIAMIDVDDFKAVNDEYGHAWGDRALLVVARWLSDLVGDTGIAGRLGGDEFSAVLDIEDPAEIPRTRTFEVDGVRFSISIGTARWSPQKSSFEHALRRADQALYANKGRSDRATQSL